MSTAGPSSPRFTHIALPTRSVEASLAWYLAWTPLVCLHDRADDEGRTVWVGHDDSDQPDSHPFVLVLIEVTGGYEEIATTLGPLAHLGFELTARADVDAVAARAAAAGCLVWPAVDLGPPVGYICAVADPDGNIVEFSHDQGVYAAARGQVAATSPPKV